MQSYDEKGKVVQSEMLEVPGAAQGKNTQEDSKLRLERERVKRLGDQIADAIKKAEQKGAVKHVIANMPNHGQEVEIGGLKFRVSYVNNRRGDVHLKLVGVDDAQEPEEA